MDPRELSIGSAFDPARFGPVVSKRQFERVMGGIDGGWFVRKAVLGPVAVAMPFDDVEDAIRIANDTPCGLAASKGSRDGSAVHRANTHHRPAPS